MKISVVIPTFNRAAKLKCCLESLKHQTHKNFDVLVCDDGSTDETSKIVSEFKKTLNISFISADHFGGPARPRNNGIQHSSADYIAFLDSDDAWHPEKLSRVTAHLNQGYDLIYHDMSIFNNSLPLKIHPIFKSRDLHSPIFNDLIIKGNPIINSSVVVRKELLISIGGISENRNLIGWEDYDTWIRLSQITENFYYLKEVLGDYHTGGISLSGQSISKEAVLLDLIREKFIQNYETSFTKNNLATFYFRQASIECANLNSIKMFKHLNELFRTKLSPGYLIRITGLLIKYAGLVSKEKLASRS